MNGTDDLFPGFMSRRIETGKVDLHVCIGGCGPPLLLLHGYPQTHVAWHKVAGPLAERFTVVAPDLRGYGESACPPDDLDHRAYAKRTMAADMVHVMKDFGFSRYLVMGHDRGARVAYRMALDNPECVARLVVIDVMTTWDQWQPEQQITRNRIGHWAFLAQPAPIPEMLIGKDPIEWLEGRLKRGTRSGTLDAFDPRALAVYGRLSDRDRIHATCEDYRASASCDLADDEADRRLGSRITCPTLVLWGSSGSLAGVADPVALWRPWCLTVSGRAIESGHFIPEENPAALLDAVLPFLGSAEAMT
jgi:haloacetate dehalogenase